MFNLSYEREEFGKFLYFNIPFVGRRGIGFADVDNAGLQKIED
jgi:hypothetical protein